MQLAGHDMLKSLGISILPASAPDFFTEDTPTAVLVRQVLGAISQFEKASTVRNSLRRASVSVRGKGGAREGNLSARQSPRLLPSHASSAGGNQSVDNCLCVRWSCVHHPTDMDMPTSGKWGRVEPQAGHGSAVP